MEDRPHIDWAQRCAAASVEGFDSLVELALDLSWAWNHVSDQIWRELDPVLWELTYNPWVMLQTVSREKLKQLFSEPVFRQHVNTLVQGRRHAYAQPPWFAKFHPQSALRSVAYFSMEFMLSEALPIYSGGLGNVAGDQLKAASDLGVPVTGVGLLYSQGYFRQIIDRDGAQQALYPYNDPGQLPIVPLREANGEWLRLEIALPGYSVWLRAWQVQVGRNRLYLLDSNDAANPPEHRGITSELYGGGPELRLKQELLLGIAGWRLLRALRIEPDVCHLNEGHAAVAVLERARDHMQVSGQPFADALAITRAGNLFTTHTAVAAGFDRFAPNLIEQYLGAYALRLGLSTHDLLALGRANPDDSSEPFNMAYLAVRGSGAVNGVSLLHGRVSRQLFENLYPQWPIAEVPIGSVTNGVHTPTWDSAAADDLWTDACGKDRWLGTLETVEADIRRASNAKLWQLRTAARASLIDYARARLSRQLAGDGVSSEALEAAGKLLDPQALTLGFARRFATYKRPNLLLHDRERLLSILTNSKRPVQLILAGKAHPADQAGCALIQEWIRFIRNSDARQHIIFLSDYDMLLTEQLVQGVDVWINTPRRPWEACGTSGMKVLVNGGLNLSELDGWWAEAYSPEVGWALGDGLDHGTDPAWDAQEANALYELLERAVIPEFYDRDGSGIPSAWVNRMRNSMAQLTPRFSSNRAVREYTERYYLPAAVNYGQRIAAQGLEGRRIIDWRLAVEQHWNSLRLLGIRFDTLADHHDVELQIDLNGLNPDAVRVEVYADGRDGAAAETVEMKRIRTQAEPPQRCVFQATLPTGRPTSDYTARVIPRFPGVAVPLECGRILWQR